HLPTAPSEALPPPSATDPAWGRSDWTFTSKLSAPPGAHHEPVRQQAPRQYSTPCSVRCSERSLLPPQRGGRYQRLPSPVPYGSRRSGSRRLHAGHRLANKRAPARLIPGFWSHPGFDVVRNFVDTSAAIHLRSSSRSLPDASHDAFSSSLPRTVFHPIHPEE